jgi:hypothetical protein
MKLFKLLVKPDVKHSKDHVHQMPEIQKVKKRYILRCFYLI